ncbi:MAG: META domain-containing protein [Thermoanaerobaculia bacterium]
MDEAVVSGAVTYDEDVALPRDAAVDVWIIDVTPGIVAAAILAETRIEAGEVRPPIPFKLRYDPSRVYADHDYGIKAVIQSGGQTLFEMPNDFRVLTKGHPTRVELWVKKVGGAPAASAGLAGTSWRVEELAGEAVPADAEGTLDFPEPGKLAGRAFCNRFSGKAEISGASIRIGPLMSTKMACGQDASARESRYFELLYKAERFAIDGSALLIYSSGSEKPTRFARRPVP